MNYYLAESINPQYKLVNKLKQKRYSCNHYLDRLEEAKQHDPEEIKKDLKRNVLIFLNLNTLSLLMHFILGFTNEIT